MLCLLEPGCRANGGNTGLQNPKLYPPSGARRLRFCRRVAPLPRLWPSRILLILGGAQCCAASERVRPMDLNYTPEEQAFREEVSAFLRERMPAEISRKVLEHKRLNKEDHVRWQKILHE